MQWHSSDRGADLLLIDPNPAIETSNICADGFAGYNFVPLANDGPAFVQVARTVIFDNFGSDMGPMCKVFKETRGATTIFGPVVLRLGDDADALSGMVKLDAFAFV